MSVHETQNPERADPGEDVEKRPAVGNDLGTKSEGVTSLPPQELTKFHQVMLIVVCTAAMITNSSNNTSVAISLPAIGHDLHINETHLQWLVSAYSLTSGCFLLFFGRLCDLYGRKFVFLLGSLSTVAFTIGCGFANDEITLDVLRALQGIGSAGTIPAAIGIMASAFPPSRMRSIAFASFGAGAPLGAATGMVLGGILTQCARPGWRATFYLSAALTALCMFGGFVYFPADPPHAKSADEDRRVDWLGAVLVTVGLVLIIFVLSDGETAFPKQWKTPYIIALLILGVFFVALFLLWQGYLEQHHFPPSASSTAPLTAPRKKLSRWTPPPLMKLSIWKRAKGRFAVVMLIAFLNFMCFLSWNFWVQLYYQWYLQLPPIETMLRLLPMIVTGIICNVIVALVVGRVPVVWLMVSGTVLTACASLLFAVINPRAPYWAFGFPAAILSVFGADFVFSSGTLFIAKIVEPDEQSLAGGLFQTMTQLGTALGLTLSTIVFNRIAQHDSHLHGHPIGHMPGQFAPPSSQLQGYKAAQWTAFAFGILAALLGLVFLRHVGIVGHEERKGKAKDVEKVEGPQASQS